MNRELEEEIAMRASSAVKRVTGLVNAATPVAVEAAAAAVVVQDPDRDQDRAEDQAQFSLVSAVLLRCSCNTRAGGQVKLLRQVELLTRGHGQFSEKSRRCVLLTGGVL